MSKVGKGGTYPADILFRSIVAIHKGCVGTPRVRRLVFEFLAAVSSMDAFLDFPVDGLLDTVLDSFEPRCQFPDILEDKSWLLARWFFEGGGEVVLLTSILAPLYTYSDFCSLSS